ncbi:MAG: hypothetical protein WDO12_04105 [Pseudomonadota bacterium]
MKTTHSLATGLFVALACNAVAGAEDHSDLFAFNAFGTFGIAHSSEGQADFTRNILVPHGTGASQKWSPKVDSVLGGQIAVHFTSTLSAVVQVVSELRDDDSYDPRIEWANLKYEITPDLSVSAGRIVTPILLFTDTRRISYALPWIRPPQEVYELYPVTNSDGVNMRWRTRFGETTHTLEMVYGRSDTPYSRNGASGKALARHQFLLRTLLERGPLSFSAGYSPSELTLPAFAPLFDAFRQFGPEGQALAERYSADHRSSTYLGAGASYDPGRWFVMAEWARDTVKGVVGGHWGWYVSTGLRYGAFTPYATWARTRPAHERSDPGLDLTTLPSESVPVATALNATLNAALANVPDQSTLGAGVRWDFARNLCLKLQYDHIDLAPGNAGTLTNFQPGFQPGGKLNVVGLSVSFVL